ncbi:MAG TPA: hypothetical protein VJM50_23265 [Pyrinomonadaceae bacterium]|nr:hypothetical protein [Pyrinomonadaceae bacterium]
MRRFVPRLAAALLTFTLGVLIVTLLNDPSFPEALRTLYARIIPRADKVEPVKGCYAAWPNAAPSQQPFGWDLTYHSVIKKTRLCPDLPVCKEWAKPAPPIQKHVAEWQGEPIVSSIEMEFFDGHASMVAFWFIRTKNQAYVWGFYPLDKDSSDGIHVIPTQPYDEVFEKISCWLRVEPEQPTFGEKGYFGFLSMYKEGKSRQMLVTYEDFIESGKDPDDDERPGPFAKVLEPLISALREDVKSSP